MNFVKSAMAAVVVAMAAAPLHALILQPDHVVVVVLEDRFTNAVGDLGNMPWVNTVANDALRYTNIAGLYAPSQPNFLALFSGSNQGVTDNYMHGDANHQFAGPNLAKSLYSAGKSFVGYSESLPADGSNVEFATEPSDPNSWYDAYARRNNAMAQFSDYAGHTNAEVNRTFAAFPSNFSALPTVSYVIPNMLNNTHGSNDDGAATVTGLRQRADTWLSDNMNAYLEWAKLNNSLLILTHDEVNEVAPPGTKLTVLVAGDSHLFEVGANNIAGTNYNLLRTLTDMYGLSPLGNSASAGRFVTNSQGQLALVPEPGTLVLLAGAAGLLMRRRAARA